VRNRLRHCKLLRPKTKPGSAPDRTPPSPKIDASMVSIEGSAQPGRSTPFGAVTQ
jgi:hypothetical protein